MLKKKASTEEQAVEENMSWLMGGVDIPNRTIEIRGEVNEQFASVIIRSVTTLCQISHDPIKIILSSPGGDVYEGLAVFDCLTTCPADIHIHANGKIFSAGFLIYLAGDIRTASPNSGFMMHSAMYSMPIDTGPKDHEVELIETKRVNGVFLDIAGARTHRNRKWWDRNSMIKNKYFNVTDAKEVGILHAPVAKKTVKKVRRGTKV